MLDLNSPQWTNLTHAYGEAADIPELLRALDTTPPADDPSAEPYYSLWSALCHQGDVYTASFAAVPHLARACETHTALVHWQVLHLIVCIEIARLNCRGPSVPGELREEYLGVIASLPHLAAKMVSAQNGLDMTVVASAAVAVSQGYAQLADAILELEVDVIVSRMG